MKSPSRRLPAGLVWILLLALGGGVGLVIGQVWLSPKPLPSPPVHQLSPAYLPPPGGNFPDFVPQVVKKAGPAVVRIDVTSLVTSNGPDHGVIPQVQEGIGSGFILTSNGLIVTNAHVVAGARQLSVTLTDGRVFPGHLVGMNVSQDVAVVKINARNLPVVQPGDSAKLLPGEWVIAIGNPFGLDNTVTLGIVSAVQRSGAAAGAPNPAEDFLQTDTAINPGNSGGPLLNAQGQVVGMNTAMRANSRGLGFAIPINTVLEVVRYILKSHRLD